MDFVDYRPYNCPYRPLSPFRPLRPLNELSGFVVNDVTTSLKLLITQNHTTKYHLTIS